MGNVKSKVRVTHVIFQAKTQANFFLLNWVPVPDAEDVHGDGVAAAGEGEPLEGGCKVGGVGVVALQPLVDQVLLEG